MSVPDNFQDGDLEIWLKRFGLCAAASGWEPAKKLAYLPAFLRGRAFAVFERLTDDERQTFDSLEKARKTALAPATEENRRLAVNL